MKQKSKDWIDNNSIKLIVGVLLLAGVVIVSAQYNKDSTVAVTTTSVPCDGLPIPTGYSLNGQSCCDDKIWVVRDYGCGFDDYCWHEVLDCSDYGKVCAPIADTDPDGCTCVECIGNEKRCGIDTYSGRHYIEQCTDTTWSFHKWCSSDQVCTDGVCVAGPTPPTECTPGDTMWDVICPDGSRAFRCTCSVAGEWMCVDYNIVCEGHEAPETPSFVAVFTIAWLLAVALIMKRRKGKDG